jgi:GT2 family glycosyltransferase
MLSILISVRNTRAMAANCLSTTLQSVNRLGLRDVEYLLIDDASEAQQQVPQLFTDFRRQLPAGTGCKVFRFRQQQHYTRALAYGFSAARGDNMLFISHDMLVTPDYIRTLLAVAAGDRRIGLVRGTSPYVDCFAQHTVAPPLPIRTFDDLDAFARYVSARWGLTTEEDAFLTGDSMLVTRAAIEKVGVLDPRYFGYFGDIDFGVRLRRAGFRMVCAKGAWLWHEGAAAYKDLQQRTNQDYAVIHAERMRTVNNAYVLFREKWDRGLPPQYPGTDAIDFERFMSVPSPATGEYQPPIAPDSAICDIEG